MKKKYIIIFFIVLAIFFIIFAYKKFKIGNNIDISDDNNILNISSYEAIVEIEIYSNKNTNKYILKQQFVKPNLFKQEVIEPENVKGLTTTFDGKKIKIENKVLNLKFEYDEYPYVEGNSLSLICFIEQYGLYEKPEIMETEKEISITIKNESQYEAYKRLYISKETSLPTKMEILDVNQKKVVYILYKEISLNKTSEDEILVN